MWGGRVYQVSDAVGEFRQQSYVAMRLVLSVGMLVAASIFILSNGYDATKCVIILTLVLFKAIESIADAIYGIMQRHSMLSYAGKSLTYKAIAGVVLFGIINIYTNSLAISCAGLIIANVILVLFYDIPIIKKQEPSLIRQIIKHSHLRESFRIMRKTFPAFIVSFLGAFSLNIPRYFIDNYNEHLSGYFGIIAMPTTLVVLLMTFILQPKVMELSQALHDKQYEKFRKSIISIERITLVIGLAVLILMYLVGAWLLSIIFGVDFTPYASALTVITVGALASALLAIYINILTIMRHFKIQTITLLVTNAILIVASGLVIPVYGLMGGVVLFVITNSVQAFTLSAAYKTYLRRLARSE
jgi:O-antigen/teichoic acid export membrane protein